MAYGLSNGHATDDVTWPPRCCVLVRSAILATAWLLVHFTYYFTYWRNLLTYFASDDDQSQSSRRSVLTEARSGGETWRDWGYFTPPPHQEGSHIVVIFLKIIDITARIRAILVCGGIRWVGGLSKSQGEELNAYKPRPLFYLRPGDDCCCRRLCDGHLSSRCPLWARPMRLSSALSAGVWRGSMCQWRSDLLQRVSDEVGRLSAIRRPRCRQPLAVWCSRLRRRWERAPPPPPVKAWFRSINPLTPTVAIWVQL